MNSIESLIIMDMIGGSICFAKKFGDDKYFMNFIKLHKLLYLAQCYSLAIRNKKLFDNPIVFDDSGPYVKGISFVPGLYGFGEIKSEMSNTTASILYKTLSKTIVGAILYKYGKLDTDEIVAFAKTTLAIKSFDLKNDIGKEIDCGLMYIAGLELCKEIKN